MANLKDVLEEGISTETVYLKITQSDNVASRFIKLPKPMIIDMASVTGSQVVTKVYWKLNGQRVFLDGNGRGSFIADECNPTSGGTGYSDVNLYIVGKYLTKRAIEKGQ